MADGARNEFELALRVGAPAWVADVGLGASYRRTWESRGRAYVDDVADEADLELGDLEQRLEDDEAGRDLFIAGLERAGQVGDEDYRATVARLVGRALADEAAVDEMAYLLSQVLDLEPLHLRALRAWIHRGQATRPNSDAGAEGPVAAEHRVTVARKKALRHR